MPKKDKKKTDQLNLVNVTEKHLKAMSWCLDNDIKVYPKKSKGGFKLICVRNGQGYQSGIVYKENEYQQRIWDFYVYLEGKYKNDSN